MLSSVLWPIHRISCTPTKVNVKHGSIGTFDKNRLAGFNGRMQVRDGFYYKGTDLLCVGFVLFDFGINVNVKIR